MTPPVTEATPPTTYGLTPGTIYDLQEFSDTFPVPAVYVMAGGFPHFRGPDGHLWFVTDDRNLPRLGSCGSP